MSDEELADALTKWRKKDPAAGLNPDAALFRCCVEFFEVPREPKSAEIVKRFRYLPGFVGVMLPAKAVLVELQQPFTMKAIFVDSASCACKCCEYRQQVKGRWRHSTGEIIGGRPVTPEGFRYISETAFKEDRGQGEPYGHREGSTNSPSDQYCAKKPWGPGGVTPHPGERSTGCYYYGRDEPGVRLWVGDLVDIDVVFRGLIIDTCRTDKKGKPVVRGKREWRLRFQGEVKEPAPQPSYLPPYPRAHPPVGRTKSSIADIWGGTRNR